MPPRRSFLGSVRTELFHPHPGPVLIALPAGPDPPPLPVSRFVTGRVVFVPEVLDGAELGHRDLNLLGWIRFREHHRLPAVMAQAFLYLHQDSALPLPLRHQSTVMTALGPQASRTMSTILPTSSAA